MFDIDWSDPSQCQTCKKEEGTEKHKLYHCPEWYEVRREIPLSGSKWKRGHFSVREWESEKHQSWGLPAEGFKDHVATDGSLLGTDGKRGACG